MKILRLGKSLDFRTEMQGYQCDFGTYTDAGGEDGLAQTYVYVEVLAAGRVETAVVGKHVPARTPA